MYMNTKHHQYKHGLSKSRQYNIWNGMLTRCYNEKSKSYAYYGKLGIKVSKEWREDFLNFWDDMKNTYFDGATIDRIDSKKDYSKENCRWVSMSEQNKNKSSVPLYSFGGETLNASDWDRKLGLKKGTVRNRIKKLGWDIAKAVTTKKKTYNQIYFDKARKVYKIQIKKYGKIMFFGRYKTKREATIARMAIND